MLSSSSAPGPSDPSATVIRTGSDGRLRFDPAHREALLDAFERGGTSAMAFARDHGVKSDYTSQEIANSEKGLEKCNRPKIDPLPDSR